MKWMGEKRPGIESVGKSGQPKVYGGLRLLYDVYLPCCLEDKNGGAEVAPQAGQSGKVEKPKW